MPLQVSSVTVTSRTTVVVVFNTAPTASTVNGADDWTVEPAALGSAEVAVESVSGATTTWTLTLHPGLTPGDVYTVTAVNAADGGGAASPNSDDATVDPDFAPDDPAAEWPHLFLEAASTAIGAELHVMRGSPTTRLVRRLSPGDSVAFVESTLGFEGSAVWIAGRRFAYTSKSDGAFHGLDPDDALLRVLERGAEVTLDMATVEPGWRL